MGRLVNRLAHPHAPEGFDQNRSLSPQPPLRCLSPKYTPASWRAVGKALAISALDAVQSNPCSRLGAPGAESAAALARLRSTSLAWARSARAAKGKKGKKAGGEEGGSDGGSGGESEGEADGGAEGRAADKRAEVTRGENACPQGAQTAPAAPAALSGAPVPCWVRVHGTPLLRRGFSLKTPPAGRLESGTLVQVVQTRAMKDGALRAAVALAGCEPQERFGLVALRCVLGFQILALGHLVAVLFLTALILRSA